MKSQRVHVGSQTWDCHIQELRSQFTEAFVSKAVSEIPRDQEGERELGQAVQALNLSSWKAGGFLNF